MNFKKKIIFTALSLLLSSTFNSAYSAHTVEESDGCGAGGGASSSASSAEKTPGDLAGQSSEGLAATPSNAPRGWEQHVSAGNAYTAEESKGSGAGGGSLSVSSGGDKSGGSKDNPFNLQKLIGENFSDFVNVFEFVGTKTTYAVCRAWRDMNLGTENTPGRGAFAILYDNNVTSEKLLRFANVHKLTLNWLGNVADV